MLTTAGRKYMMNVVTGQLAQEGILVGLYTNTVAWTKNTTLADLVEVAATGYGRQAAVSWTPPDTLAGGEEHSQATDVQFSDDDAGAVTVKGFFFVTAGTGVFLGGDPFAADLVIPGGGGVLTVTPELVDTTYP